MPYKFNPFTGNLDYYQAASGNTMPIPEQIGGLVLWLDANSGVTQSGGLVSQWVSRDPNQWTFAQSSGSAQPSLVTNDINGLPAVSFNGTSTYLQLSNGVLPILYFLPNGGAIYIVGKHKGFLGSPVYESAFLGGGASTAGSNAGATFSFTNDPSYGPFFYGTGSYAVSASGLTLDTNYHTFYAAALTNSYATSFNMGIDSSIVSGTGVNIGSYTASSTYIGGPSNSFSNISIAAIFMFNQLLSTTNDALLRSYILSTYGI